MTTDQFKAKCTALKLKGVTLARILGVNPLAVYRWRKGTVPVPQPVAVILDLLSKRKAPWEYQPPK